jgi:Na+/glutamate symporter
MSSTDGDADFGGVDPEALETAVQRGVRRELHRVTRNVAQVVGGVLFALFVIPALLSVLLPPLFEVGVPPTVFVAGGLVCVYGLVAYGWRLPPFR